MSIVATGPSSWARRTPDPPVSLARYASSDSIGSDGNKNVLIWGPPDDAAGTRASRHRRIHLAMLPGSILLFITRKRCEMRSTNTSS